MKKGLVLQNRDTKLLYFLADYKTITIDNTKYIYMTKSYQEKRICRLVKEKYLTRLKHREITLGKKGKEFLKEMNIQIKEHCRNPNNIERLKVISDIAAFTSYTMYFSPSWKLKNKDEPTQDSRRYLGTMFFEGKLYSVYSIYGEKDNKYISSIYYDIKKDKEYDYSIIFTNSIDKIIHHKKSFKYLRRKLLLIEYNEFNKRVIRNYDRIKQFISIDISRKYKIEGTNYENMDYLVDGEYYFKIALFIDIDELERIANFLNFYSEYREKFFFITLKENEKYLKEIIINCKTIIIDKSIIEEYLNEEYNEINGLVYD